jgi:hypothetical protein
MKVVIGTAHDEKYDELAGITFPTVRRYVDRHGYVLAYNPRIDPIDADACKAKLFLAHYATGQYGPDDVFMWIDTDALVMNSEKPVKQVVGQWMYPGGSCHFLWAYDFNGPNSGVWFARFSPQAAHYVRVYDQTCRGMGWGDQEGMIQKMLQPPFCEWVHLVPGALFNAYDYSLYGIENWPHKEQVNAYQPGSFILHAAGLSGEHRLSVLRHYAALAT